MKTRTIKNLTLVQATESRCDVFFTMNGETRLVGHYNRPLSFLSKDDEKSEKDLVMNYEFAPFCDYTEIIKRWQTGMTMEKYKTRRNIQ